MSKATAEEPESLKEHLARISEGRVQELNRPCATPSSSSRPGFQRSFEKHLNQELEYSFPDPPPFSHHDPERSLPPQATPIPPFFGPILRSGIYIPTPAVILLGLLLLLETSIIVFYTAVALYSTLPAAGFPLSGPRGQGCMPGTGSLNIAPNIYLANADHPGPAAVTESAAATAASVAGPSSFSLSVVTVTAPTPTSTVISTIPAITPSLVFSTIFSTTDVLASPSAAA
ncbi:hypothetical protein ANO11243_025800 [Dothideomycetidae sp. 11243]|nr:hypothetical protein ANO11243_025800 [fungal sp. No.11243]